VLSAGKMPVLEAFVGITVFFDVNNFDIPFKT
jgi:hypothetical protein